MNKILIQFIQTLDTSMKHFLAQTGEGLSNLSVNQIQYLEAIAALDSPTISEIALHMDYSKPSVTEAVKKLEKLGFISKQRSVEDRRVVHVCLTEKGEQLKHSQQQTLEHYLNFIQSALEEEELDQFEQILQKLVTAFEQTNQQGKQA